MLFDYYLCFLLLKVTVAAIAAIDMTASIIINVESLVWAAVVVVVTGAAVVSAGVSAVPMAARVSQVEGAKYDPQNFLLMHAMGPNVAGVIGTAVCAGYMISRLTWFF